MWPQDGRGYVAGSGYKELIRKGGGGKVFLTTPHHLGAGYPPPPPKVASVSWVAPDGKKMVQTDRQIDRKTDRPDGWNLQSISSSESQI